METNSNFLKLSWEVPLMLEIVSLGLLLPYLSTILVNGTRLCQPAQSQEFVSWSCKSPSQPIKAVLTAKASGLYRK